MEIFHQTPHFRSEKYESNAMSSYIHKIKNKK